MAGLIREVVETRVGVWVRFLRRRAMLDVALSCLPMVAQLPWKGQATATGLELELLAAAVQAEDACVAARGVHVWTAERLSQRGLCARLAVLLCMEYWALAS